jgi:hypothetical protein
VRTSISAFLLAHTGNQFAAMNAARSNEWKLLIIIIIAIARSVCHNSALLSQHLNLHFEYFTVRCATAAMRAEFSLHNYLIFLSLSPHSLFYDRRLLQSAFLSLCFTFFFHYDIFTLAMELN